MRETEQRFILIVSLWLKSDDVSAFEAYERRAARLLEKYSGRIERIVRVRKQTVEKDAPFEIHIVSFPNENKFADYLADSERGELADLRDRIIARTEIVFGFDVNYYT